MAKNISFKIRYWKQNGPKDKGHFDEREMKNIPDDTSFLEMLDILLQCQQFLYLAGRLHPAITLAGGIIEI